MNDPKLATKRSRVVSKAKREGVTKDEAWSTIQHEWGYDFEGHMLMDTINRKYDDKEQ